MNLPNIITLGRIMTVPFFWGLCLYWRADIPYYHIFPAAVFTLACMSDALDGFLAKKLNQRTALGSLIDPLADKMLLVSAFLALTFLERISFDFRVPVWLTLMVVSRDALLIIGASLIHSMQGHFEPKTNILGKITTFFQMFFIVVLLWRSPLIFIEITTWVCAAFTLMSGLIYLRVGTALLSRNGAAS